MEEKLFRGEEAWWAKMTPEDIAAEEERAKKPEPPPKVELPDMGLYLPEILKKTQEPVERPKIEPYLPMIMKEWEPTKEPLPTPVDVNVEIPTIESTHNITNVFTVDGRVLYTTISRIISRVLARTIGATATSNTIPGR